MVIAVVGDSYERVQMRKTENNLLLRARQLGDLIDFKSLYQKPCTELGHFYILRLKNPDDNTWMGKIETVCNLIKKN